MPAGKQNGITLTFSKKNQRAKEKIERAVKDGWKQTDYICEAIMAFDENKVKYDKDIKESIDMTLVEKMVEKMVSKKIEELGSSIVGNENATTIIQQSVEQDISDLEDNIEGIDVSDD